MRGLLICLGVIACLSAKGDPGDTLRFALPGWVELELVEVGGQSRIPLKYLYTGEDKDMLADISSPTYWIGKFEVSQKQYEAVMGENPSKVQDDERLPVTNVKWKDAVEFCDRLNEVVRGDIPEGYRFDLPTMVEWAHAYTGGTTNALRYSGSDDLESVAWHGVGIDTNRIESGSVHFPGLKSANALKAFDMSGNVAEYVFIADAKGGNISMGGSFMGAEQACELCGFSRVARDASNRDLGFRVALVQTWARDPGGKMGALGIKGRTLLRSGCPALARKYLAQALEQEGLSAEESRMLNSEWVKADLACGYDVGTWPDLLQTLSKTLGGLGYRAGEYLQFWHADQAAAGFEALRKRTADLYRRHGIFGRQVEVSDLPKEIAAKFSSSTRDRVQVVLCDFTGDGLDDLVVELLGQADPDGELYGFFERQREGGYALVGEPIRVVGMCVVPAEQGAPVFLVMLKRTHDVLSAGVIDCTVINGKSCLRIAWPLERSYGLREFAGEAVDQRLPFMGRRNRAHIRNLAEGNYQRPLCWPWKAQ